LGVGVLGFWFGGLGAPPNPPTPKPPIPNPQSPIYYNLYPFV